MYPPLILTLAHSQGSILSFLLSVFFATGWQLALDHLLNFPFLPSCYGQDEPNHLEPKSNIPLGSLDGGVPGLRSHSNLVG
jgi:hypothetical protein